MIINKKPTIKNIGSFSLQFLNSCSIEEKEFRGISHLVEHCMCEKVKEMENELTKYDLSYNACTSSDGIIFYLTGLDKYVNKFKYKFLEAILSYEIDKDIFERERNIIIQEYIQSLSNQTSEFFQNFNKKMFNDYGPIGYIEDLKNISYLKFIEFKNKYFSIPDYIINVSKHKFKKDRKNIYNIKSYYSKPNEVERNFSILTDNKIKYESYSKFDENRCILFYMFFNDNDEETYKKFMYYFIFCKYYNEGLTSPLYKNIREKLQCVYNISSRIKYINKNEFMYFTFLNTSSKKLEEVKKELLACYKNIELDENRFNDIVFSIKIEEEKAKLLDNMKFEESSFNKKIKKLMKKMDFNFNEFTEFVNNNFNEDDFNLIDDKEFKDVCKERKIVNE